MGLRRQGCTVFLAPQSRAGDRLRAALGLALALLAGPAAPARAADPVVAIVLPGGACELRQVPAQALAGVTAELERARQDAAGLAQRLAADAAAARYAGAREAVPAFGAWAYDWVQSYITAYRIAGRMVASAAAVLRGDATGLADDVVEQMSEPMRRAFEERVLARAAPPATLRRDLDMAATMVEAGWNRAQDSALAPLRAFPAAPAGSVASLRVDPAAAAGAAAVALRPPAGGAAGGRAAGGAGEDSPGADPASLFFHSLRPIAARVSAVMLRATEAGSLVATVGAVGYRFGGVPGLAAGTVGGVGAYWGIDWAFNRADAALNRGDFEAQSLAVIARAEAAVAEEAGRAVLAALDARVARLAVRGGCPDTATGGATGGAAP